MTETILFVHGTGVRNAASERSFALINGKLASHLPRYRLAACNWGDAFGARLNANGQSIPGYVDGGAAGMALEAAAMARWTLLADDPLLELRVTEWNMPLGGSQGPVMWSRMLQTATAGQPLAMLASWGLAEPWSVFIDDLDNDAQWRGTFSGIKGTVGELAAPVARALAAAFLRWLRVRGEAGITGAQRDRLVAALQAYFGAGAGLRDWLADRLTNFAVPRRSAMSDASGAALGDILRYQARGATLRNFIGERVRQTGASVILAHSLGGIAAVDWLAEEARGMAALVTVGSQAPFFYEIDALASRAFGSGLPDFFPRRWLNFYDPRDFLSYAGGALFPGVARDVKVDNGQPFPESHSAYWQNDDEVWPEIARFLP